MKARDLVQAIKRKAGPFEEVVVRNHVNGRTYTIGKVEREVHEDAADAGTVWLVVEEN